MENNIKLFALGGLDESGKNMYIVEINNEIFILEAGLKYPESSMPGIDSIIPDTQYLVQNKSRVKGYFISHGHDDTMGALPYLIKEIPAPVYCSNVTAYFIEDAAKRFHCDVKFNFVIVKSGQSIKIGKVDFLFFSTTHSIGESLGCGIATEDGYIVYATDFIMDYGALPQYRMDIKTLAKLAEKKILCLMCESLGADKQGHTSPNHKLTPHIERLFLETSGRIIAAVYTQNLFGVREIIDLAIRSKRKIVLYSKEMEQIIRQVSKLGILSIPQGFLLTTDDIGRPGCEDIVILVSGVGEKVFHSLSRIAGGDKVKNLVVQESDTFVIATPPVNGLEVTFAKTVDDLYKSGAKILSVNKKKIVSMHAHCEDIKMMLSLLMPKYYMPIKGDYRLLVANAEVAMSAQSTFNHNNVLVYDNGMVAEFKNGQYLGCTKNINAGDVMVDGLGVGDVGSYVLTDRQKLADNGILVIAASIDSKDKTIIAGPDIQMRGLVYLKDNDELVREISKIFESMIFELITRGNMEIKDAKIKIKEKLLIAIRRGTGKDPIILPEIIAVKKG